MPPKSIAVWFHTLPHNGKKIRPFASIFKTHLRKVDDVSPKILSWARIHFLATEVRERALAISRIFFYKLFTFFK